jgi:hypothetical protein
MEKAIDARQEEIQRLQEQLKGRDSQVQQLGGEGFVESRLELRCS